MREGQKDSLIIADLAADCIENNVIESALHEVCKEIRQEATKEYPFLPPPGEILKRAVKRTNFKKTKPTEKAAPRERVEKAPSVSWAYLKYSEFTENMFSQLRVHMTSFTDPYRRANYRKYLISECLFPDDWQGF